MPSSTFRLQPLLVARQEQRERQRVLLANVLASERELQTQRHQIERELRDEQCRVRVGSAPGRVDVARLAAAQQYEATLRECLAAFTEKQHTLEEEIAAQRQAVMDAECEVRKLEKLRERQQERQRIEAARIEAKQLNEISAAHVKRPLGD